MKTLKNIYTDKESLLTLYTIGKYAIRCSFSHPSFNDYNEFRFESFSMFEPDQDELQKTIKEEGHKSFRDIEIEDDIYKQLVKEYQDYIDSENKEVYHFDLESRITPYLDKIEVSYEDLYYLTDLLKQIMVDTFECHFKDSFYKDIDCPEYKFVKINEEDY